MNTRPLLRIFFKHARNDLFQPWRVSVGNLSTGTVYNVMKKSSKTLTWEWFLSSAYFVQQTTKTPHITFIVILSKINGFRRQIAGSSDRCFRKILPFLQLFCNSKVSKFQKPILFNKNISQFDVSVYYIIFVMEIIQSKTELAKPGNDLPLRYFFEVISFDILMKIALLCKF